MKIKYVVHEDFVNYKKPSMFIGCHSCSFKCDKEMGEAVCQNGGLASMPDISIDTDELVRTYLENSITKAVVFGGLEPFDDIKDIVTFVHGLRSGGHMDDVVIYTGYTEEEIKGIFGRCFEKLQNIGNVIIKYGRYRGGEKHFDDVLGVYLVGDNQYAKRIS